MHANICDMAQHCVSRTVNPAKNKDKTATALQISNEQQCIEHEPGCH